MLITDLNDDELLIIFSYCLEIDHDNLSKVCKLFENLIEVNFTEAKCRNLLMVTHRKKYPELFERTLHDQMKYAERMRAHQNWVFGSCQQSIFFQHRENFITLMQLDQDFLYTTDLGEFNVYERHKTEGINVKSLLKIGSKNDSVINGLKRKGDIIAGVKANGSLFTYSESQGYSSEAVRDGNEKVNKFDFHNDIFVTTTNSDTRFHRQEVELGLTTFETIDMKSKLRGFDDIQINPTGRTLLGTSNSEFHLIDPCIGEMTDNFTHFSHIYKSQWINDSSFLFTSRNNPLCLIDTRQGFKIQDFSCGRFTATCIDYDGRYGILYGTLLGMVILCDLRNPTTFERVFHLDTATVCREITSDEIHLFVSTDNAIHLLNFNS